MSDPTHVANEYQGQYAGGFDNSQWEVILFEAKTFFSRWYQSFLSIYPPLDKFVYRIFFIYKSLSWTGDL